MKEKTQENLAKTMSAAGRIPNFARADNIGHICNIKKDSTKQT